MMDVDSLAQALFGGKRAETQEVSTDGTTRTYIGRAVSDSEGGTVRVDLGGDVTLPDDLYDEDGNVVAEWDGTGIEISTSPQVLEGEDVIVTLVGGSATKKPMVTAVAGAGDRQDERIHAIEADYVKATELEADVADIGFLKADSATITALQADTAKVHDLTAAQLTAATGYVGELQAGSVTAQDIVAGKATVGQLAADHVSVSDLDAATARIGDLEADHVSVSDFQAEQANIDNLQAATADIDTIRANSAKVQNLTAAQLEADHATIGTLDTTYMHANMSNADVAWIQNGTIKNGAIVSAMINDVSANKLTAGTINGSVINVTNLNADNITTGTINGQRIGEGSLSLDKLSENVYTESEVDTIVDGLNDRIDGAIETHTGTVVPTLNNQPASSWNTTALKDEHVGDVYYVVNSQSQQNGYCYRFTKSGSTYSWQLIKDSDVTAALSRLTTAEGKITTFDSDISQLKTDTGTLTTKTTSLETRMSDAESDILDKVDTTTFNSLEDTVDGHTQTLSQHTTAISNKADSSTVTAVTNRVSKNEQDISGINTTIGELQETVESKADGSTVSTISNKLNTVSDTVDGHTQTLTSVQNTLSTKADSSTVSTLTTKVNNVSDTVDGHTSQLSSITTTQTTMQNTLDKTVKSSIQLWYSKANTTAPSKPTSQVTSTSTSGNAWRIVVPAYSSSYPHYYYCWQYEYTDGTYGWSAVVRDIAMGESQSTARTADSNASAAVTTANTASTNASTALSTANTANTNASDAKTAAATANTTASEAKTTAETAASDASTAKTNAASAVTTANSANTKANANIKSSVQLWFTKANSTAPNKPTSVVSTSNANTANAWNLVVPVWNSSYPHYFYCYQQQKGDGNYQWTDVVYDRATSEAQQLANTTSTSLSTLQEDYATYKQTTTENVSSIGTRLTTAEGKISTAESNITQNATNINAKVSKNDVINQINLSTEGAKIQASKVEIDGTAVFSAIKSSADAAYDAKGAAQTVQNNLNNNMRSCLVGQSGSTATNQWYKVASTTITAQYVDKIIVFDVFNSGGFGAVNRSGRLTVHVRAGSGINSVELPAATWESRGVGVVLSDFVLAYKLTAGSKIDAELWCRCAYAYTGYLFKVVYEGDRVAIVPNQWTLYNTWTAGSQSAITSGYTRVVSTDVNSAQVSIDGLEIGGRNLAKASDAVATPTAYNALDIYLSEPFEAEQTYVFQLWDVDVSHSAKSTALLGVDVYYCGSSIKMSGWHGATYFTNGHADHLQLTLTPHESANTYATGGSETTSNPISDASSIAKKYIRLYNSVPMTSGTMNLTVGKWKLEKGNRATDWSPAPEDVAASAVKRTQRIWYRKSAAGAPATPGTASSNWVTKADDGDNAWTKMHVAISSSAKYIYTCEQYEMANGTVGYTSVLLDNTITVIDGGNIITGSVTANKLNASDINASKTLTVGAMTDAAAATILNSNIVGGGVNLIGGFNKTYISNASYDHLTGKMTSLTTTNTSDGSVYVQFYRGTTKNSVGTFVRQLDALGNSTNVGQMLHATFEKASDFTHVRLKFNGNKADAGVIWDVSSIEDGTELSLSCRLDSISSDGKGNGGVLSEINLRRGNAVSAWSLAPQDEVVGGRNLLAKTKELTSGVWVYDGATRGDNVALIATADKRIYQLPSVGYWTWTNDTTYAVSVDARADASTVLEINAVGASPSGMKKQFTVGTSWERYVFVFTVTNGNTGSLSFYRKGSASTTLYLRRPKLEVGNTATDWSPAPEDVDAAITDAAKTATSYVTDITGGGIMVHPSGNQNTGVRVTSDVDILRSGTSVANYGATARIGTLAGKHVTIDSDSVDLMDGNASLATFGANDTHIGMSGTGNVYMANDKFLLSAVTTEGTWDSTEGSVTTSVPYTEVKSGFKAQNIGTNYRVYSGLNSTLGYNDDGRYTASDTYIDAWVEDSSGHELHRAYVELWADPLYNTAIRLSGDSVELLGDDVTYVSPYNSYPLQLGKPVVRSANKSMTITSTNTWVDGPSVYLDQGQWLVVGVACFNSGSSSGNRKLRAQLRLDTSVYVEGTEVRVATNEYGRIQATAIMTVNSAEGLDATLVLSSSMTFTSATTSYVTAVQLA